MGQKPAYSNTSEKYRPSELNLDANFVAPKTVYNFGPALQVAKKVEENAIVKKTKSVGGGEIRLDTTDISEALRNEPTRKVARRIIDEVSKFTVIDEDHQAPSTKGKLIKMYEALYPGRFTAANQESYTRVEQVASDHTQETGSIDLSVDKRITAAKMAKNFIASRISSSAYKTQEQKITAVDTPSVEIKPEQAEQKRGGVLRPGKKVSHESRSVDSTLTQPLVEKTMPVEPEEVEKSIPVAPEEVVSTVSVPLNSEEAIETTTLTKPDTEESLLSPLPTETKNEESKKPLSVNPLEKLMMGVNEEDYTDNETTPSSLNETQALDKKIQSAETRATTPTFMSRLSGEYSAKQEDEQQENQDQEPIEEPAAQQSIEPNTERNQRKLTVVHNVAKTLETLHGDMWWKNLLFTGKVAEEEASIPHNIENTIKLASWNEQVANNPVFQDLKAA